MAASIGNLTKELNGNHWFCYIVNLNEKIMKVFNISYRNVVAIGRHQRHCNQIKEGIER
jgi:hypothetical protein